jgi:hypothetical protein
MNPQFRTSEFFFNSYFWQWLRYFKRNCWTNLRAIFYNQACW